MTPLALESERPRSGTPAPGNGTWRRLITLEPGRRQRLGPLPQLRGVWVIEEDVMVVVGSAVETVEVLEGDEEVTAVAGFLAGYSGNTRVSYATDLRIFAAWCHEGHLGLFGLRRSHLELFGRWMKENGRMRSTVARRVSTLIQLLPLLRTGRPDRTQPGP
jgi:hypothetical protein